MSGWLELFSQTFERVQRELQVVSGVSGCDADAQAGGTLRYRGEQNGCYDYIVLAQAAGTESGRGFIPEDHGDDGGFGEAHVIAQLAESVAQEVRVFL